MGDVEMTGLKGAKPRPARLQSAVHQDQAR